MFEPASYESNLLARASLDQCVKCTICETQCPVLAVTPLFSGPKFVGPQAERYRHGLVVDHSLDYCSSCGTCTLVCPQGVKIAELNSVARAAMKKGHTPLRDQIISRTSFMGKAMKPVAPLANAVLHNSAARWAMEKTLGIHRKAAMPTAHSHSFSDWWKKHTPPSAPTRGKVVYFHGCAGEFFEVETSIMTVEVLEHLGFEVITPTQGCCGLPMQSNGLFDAARKHVRTLADQLGVEPDAPIVASASSCVTMLKHEAHDIMGVDDESLIKVGSRIREVSEFLLDLADHDDLPLDFSPIEMTAPYHAPCQLKGQGMGRPAVELLKLIPGLTVVDAEATCCGIAGTYGVKKEKYDIGQAVGRPLFDKVREINPDFAICDTETCRWQIATATGATVVHPIWFLHKAYGLG
ncbi:MAG: anaerobic glycerol-3-phosphate dehydrogenase subunit C [Propionibacteriaceae bacterium]|jgi:glycerol-3-phosphate dehydrogenase subunit C|nr:anaerobic glycerol-3-phosphate dehydrogenase subunit C [Propionibacteriaceae bacterium]